MENVIGFWACMIIAAIYECSNKKAAWVLWSIFAIFNAIKIQGWL